MTGRSLALAALAVILAAAPAIAGVQTNGVQINGVQSNGVQINGVQINGVQINGVQINGVQINGVQINGVQINGTQIQGSFIGSGTSTQAFTCSHREDEQGYALPESCSPCAKLVTDADPYCETNWWDSICVSEARSMCIATVTSGSLLNATMANGTVRTMKIDSRTQQGWVWDGAVWRNNSDVWSNVISWRLPHSPATTGEALSMGRESNSCVKTVCDMDSYCCNNYWDSICVTEAESYCGKSRYSTVGDSVCGYLPGSTTPREAYFIGGTWNMDSGYQGAGGKNPRTPAGTFSIGCRGTGAIAKCVDMGYKPWTGYANDRLHQACVRMVRADFCGDGTPWTTDGNPIDVEDYAGYQRGAEPWYYEAGWGPNGARYLSLTRKGFSSTASLDAYADAHPYCRRTSTSGWGYEITEVYADNWDEAHTLNSSENLIRTDAETPCNPDPMSINPCP